MKRKGVTKVIDYKKKIFWIIFWFWIVFLPTSFAITIFADMPKPYFHWAYLKDRLFWMFLILLAISTLFFSSKLSWESSQKKFNILDVVGGLLFGLFFSSLVTTIYVVFALNQVPDSNLDTYDPTLSIVLFFLFQFPLFFVWMFLNYLIATRNSIRNGQHITNVKMCFILFFFGLFNNWETLVFNVEQEKKYYSFLIIITKKNFYVLTTTNNKNVNSISFGEIKTIIHYDEEGQPIKKKQKIPIDNEIIELLKFKETMLKKCQLDQIYLIYYYDNNKEAFKIIGKPDNVTVVETFNLKKVILKNDQEVNLKQDKKAILKKIKN